MPQTVTATAGEDDDAAPDADVTLSHTLNGGDYTGVAADSVTVTIYENDPVIPPDQGPGNRIITYPPPAGVTVDPLQLTIQEGESGSYTVGLDSAPSSSVTVTVKVPDDADLTVSPDSLTLTPDNWETAQTVTVSATEDDDAIADEAGISHDIIGGGYSITGMATVAVAVTDDDTAGVTINPNALTVGEGSSESYTLVLDTQPSEDVTVEIDGASGDVSANPTSLTFTPDNWDTEQTVTVNAAEDDDAAADEMVTLTHTVSGGDYQGVTADSVVVTIIENDASTLSVSDVQAGEDAGHMVFEVTISAANDQEATVSYATSDDTAAAGSDYADTSGTLTFPANSVASQTIRVPVTDDAEDESEETFTLTLSQASVATLAGGGATLAVTGTITDNDDPAVTVSFGTGSHTVDEGETVEVTVTLSADPEREVSIPLTATVQDGASDGDYSGVPGSVVFQSGETEKSFTFAATDDELDDDGESVALGFGDLPVGVTAGSVASSTVSITDNDTRGVTVSPTTLSVTEGGSGSYTVVLTTQPSEDVTVEIGGASGDVSANPTSLTFTPDNWGTTQAVTVNAAEDDDAAADEMVTLTHTVSGGDYQGVSADDVTVTVTEDDAAGVTINPNALTVSEGGSGSYTVVLTTQPSEDVTVEIGGASGDVSANPTSLTFTPDNWDTEQTVTVNAAEDDDAAADAAVTLAHTVSSGDYAGVTADSVVVTIIENDASTLSVSDVQAGEDAGHMVFEVTISAANDQEATVSYATSDDTAAAGSDYADTSGTLTFPANSVASQTIRVPVTDDAEDESEETFTLTLSQASVATLAGGGATLAVTGTITDNDDPAVTVSFGTGSHTVDEGGTVEVTVTLNADPERTVTIPLTATVQDGASDGDYSGVPGSVVFTSGETEKSFTFAATEDQVDDDGESVDLGFGGLPVGVTAGSVASSTVSITDNDTRGVTVSPTTLSVTEGGSGSYTVVLTTQPSEDVTVEIGGASGDVSANPHVPDLHAGQLGHRADGDRQRRRRRRRVSRCWGDADPHGERGRLSGSISRRCDCDRHRERHGGGDGVIREERPSDARRSGRSLCRTDSERRSRKRCGHPDNGLASEHRRRGRLFGCSRAGDLRSR